MSSSTILSDKWLKASIIGTIWASSEIVLGSFLHNLRVPFSGSILTSIALIVLISVSYYWKEKGLFWRAGLICALMKTMSPSAVIFGPMIAIFTESVLLEGAVRLLGKNIAGFVVGSLLAVSWSFVQKILNFLIFYGFNMVELYKNLMQFFEKQFNFQFDSLWVPIFLLLSVYMLTGIIAGVTGIVIGKKLTSQPLILNSSLLQPKEYTIYEKNTAPFTYSVSWLFTHVILIIGSLVTISYTSWKIWIPATLVVILLWIFKYKRALRQLLKPKFWLFFIVITMLTAFVFTHMQSKTLFDSLLIGIEMNFRATLLILGFSVLGTELYNPKIRNYFRRTYFKQLPLALELATESLPGLIASLPTIRTILKNPVSMVQQFIAYAEYRLRELKKDSEPVKKVIILAGPVSSGKTTLLQKIVDGLQKNSKPVGGIISPKVFENNQRIGYDVFDIDSEVKMPLMRNNIVGDYKKIGDFSLFPDGFQFGIDRFKKMVQTPGIYLCIDEIGRLELDNLGWADSLIDGLQLPSNTLIITVRDSLLNEVIKKFKISNPKIYYTYICSDTEILNELLNN